MPRTTATSGPAFEPQKVGGLREAGALKSESPVTNGKKKSHLKPMNDLERARFSRALQEVHRLLEDFIPSHIVVGGIVYGWAEQGYFSEDGRRPTSEDLQ